MSCQCRGRTRRAHPPTATSAHLPLDSGAASAAARNWRFRFSRVHSHAQHSTSHLLHGGSTSSSCGRGVAARVRVRGVPRRPSQHRVQLRPPRRPRSRLRRGAQGRAGAAGEHFSNAGIKHPKPGENFVQLRYAHHFDGPVRCDRRVSTESENDARTSYLAACRRTSTTTWAVPR